LNSVRGVTRRGVRTPCKAALSHAVVSNQISTKDAARNIKVDER
jgi:hypothetical protein